MIQYDGMSQRRVSFSVGEYYHIYNRGTDKREIFLDEMDKKRFTKLLFVANGSNPFVFRDFPIGLPYVEFERGETITAIGAYCLMPNHFHLVVRETTECGISKFLSKVLTSYSSYFNKKYGRTGRLFEGTFKAKHAGSDEYLKYLFAYCHLNPVKMIEPKWKEEGIVDRAGAKQHLMNYNYSSYLDYQGVGRLESKILNKELFPDYFTEVQNFDGYINEWLSFGHYIG